MDQKQNEPKVLCGVCAALMKEAGVKIRQLPGRTEKVTCENCGRRRFGGAYEIEKRIATAAEPPRNDRKDKQDG